MSRLSGGRTIVLPAVDNSCMTDYCGTWGKAFLRAIHAPFNSETDKFLRAWAAAENTTAKWNPFGSTQGAQFPVTHNSSGTLNSARVRDYPDWQTGVTYTAQCISNGNYSQLLNLVQLGQSSTSMALALSKSQWGTRLGAFNILTNGNLTTYPIGNCYPVPPVSWTRVIHPGDTGSDVDELLRHLGSYQMYIGSLLRPNTPVFKVMSWQVRNRQKPTGFVSAPLYKILTGHA